MGTKYKRKRRNRRRNIIRALLNLLLIVGGSILLAVFTVYCLKTWEKSKWEEAISEKQESEGYGTGDYGEVESVDDSVPNESGTSYEMGTSKENGDFVLEKPVKRTGEEVTARLEELSKSYPKINDILEKKESYSEDMLAALANNPEMTEFVAGYTAKGKLGSTEKKFQISLTKEEKNQAYPLFLQWDSRWGYVSYGDDSNIGLSGCGPTCLSMVLYYKTKDESRTPDVLAAYAMKEGYYVSGTGTAWAFMEDAARHYGLRVKTLTRSEEALKAALDKGNTLICAMGPGDFTAVGHFIVLYGYDEEGFFVNDPNSRARSQKSWSYDEIYTQIKAIWAYY